MTVYVDELRVYGPTALRIFQGGSAHLTADTLEELHAFARQIGMRPEWFQDARVPHYDLTPKRHRRALVLGAHMVPAREQARRRIQQRRGEP